MVTLKWQLNLKTSSEERHKSRQVPLAASSICYAYVMFYLLLASWTYTTHSHLFNFILAYVSEKDSVSGVN